MKRVAIILACLGVAACGGEDRQDLRQWMKDSTKDFKGRIPPLPGIKSFPPVAFEVGDLVDPYNVSKIEPERKAGSGGIKPDLDRRKEPLEAYPLDNMAMVGSYTKAGQPYALLRVDNLLYQVKVGDYLGQNYGRITKIGETEIVLREIVQDGSGEWIERIAKLQLQEGSTK